MSKVLNYLGTPHDPQKKKADNVIIIPDDSEFVPFSPEKASGAFEESEDGELKEAEPVETMQEKAEREVLEIMEKAESEAKKIISAAMAQAVDIKETAKKSGYDEAFQSRSDAVSAVLTESVAVLEKIKLSQNAFIEKYSEELGTLAIEIAEKILKHELEMDPLAMCDVAENAMSSIKEAKWAVLSLSKELVPLIELLQSELPEKCPSVTSLEIVGGQIPKGALLVDSTQGIIDASIDVQLKNLAQRFGQIKQKRDLT